MKLFLMRNSYEEIRKALEQYEINSSILRSKKPVHLQTGLCVRVLVQDLFRLFAQEKWAVSRSLRQFKNF